MDPLSVTAGILAILSAVSASVQTAKTLYNAPRELDVLTAKLNDLASIVRDISKLPDLHRSSITSLSPILQSTKEKLLELDELISYRLTRPASGLRVDRLQWGRHRPQVKELRTQLRRTRMDLVASMGVLNSYVVSF